MVIRKCALLLLMVTASFIVRAEENSEFAVKSIEEFDTLISTSTKPVVTQFHSGCPVCLVTGAMVREVAGRYKNDIKFIEVDINNLAGLADRYSITALPTVIIFDAKKEPILQHKLPDPKKDMLEDAIKKSIGKYGDARNWRCYLLYIVLFVAILLGLILVLRRR